MLVNINILINLQVRCPDCDGGFYHGMAYGTGFTTITKTTNSIGGGYYSGTGTTRKYQLSLLTTNTWQRSTADASGTPPATAGAVPQALHDSLLTPAKIPCCGKYTPIQGPVVVRTGRYRFGFNGQELDNEVTGVTGSHLAFEYRIHDARIGRFLSVDPHADNYPNASPYCYVENNPIMRIDPDGRDWYQAESGAVIWQKGDDSGVEINGEKFNNIGTTYSQNIGNGVTIGYTQNEATSMTTNTMSSDQWVPQYSKSDWGGTPANQACNKACDAMLANNGNSSNGMTIIVNDGGNGRAGSANGGAANAISKMSAALDLGNPTKVNIDFRAGTGSGDKMEDHFVVVQGKTEQLQNGRVTSTAFHYFDPGTSHRSKGTSSSNTLGFQNNRLVGSHINNGLPIVVTSIRPTR